MKVVARVMVSFTQIEISTLSPVMSSAVPSVLPLVALMELMNFLRDFLVRVWHVKVRHADSGFVRLCSS